MFWDFFFAIHFFWILFFFFFFMFFSVMFSLFFFLSSFWIFKSSTYSNTLHYDYLFLFSIFWSHFFKVFCVFVDDFDLKYIELKWDPQNAINFYFYLLNLIFADILDLIWFWFDLIFFFNYFSFLGDLIFKLLFFFWINFRQKMEKFKKQNKQNNKVSDQLISFWMIYLIGEHSS